MIPTVLAYNHPDTAATVDVALETGQTMIFPTDTVYGIGGNPWDSRTIHHVCRLKERSPDQPFTLHLWHIDQIARYARCTPEVTRLIERLLPGPYTLLLPASQQAPPATVLDGKVGIRVPNHPFFLDHLRRPVFATSVNRHGEPPLGDVSIIIESFTEVDLIITGPVSSTASAILDLTVKPPRLIRGALSDEIRDLLDEE